MMTRLVHQGKKAPRVRQKALDLVRYLPQKDWTGQIHAVWDFVKNHIRYVRDIRGVETIHIADEILRQGQGDCDDKAILLASMLESIGHPTRFVAVGFQPGKFKHVFVETKIGPRWLALETTEAVRMGWRPPNIASAMVQNN